MNPELALEIVTDRHFMINMALETDESKRDEKVENKLITIVADYQARTEELESITKQNQDLMRKTDLEIANQAKKLDLQERNISILNDQLETVREDRAEARSKNEIIENDMRNRNQKIGTLTGEIHVYRTREKWGIISFIVLILSSLWWLHGNIWHWAWLETHTKGIECQLAGQLLLISITLSVSDYKRWKYWVSLSIAVFIAMLAM